MANQRGYEYKKNWFKSNLVAIPAGIVGNCSACIFRDLPKYCAKMSCTYLDNDADFIESVYWCAKGVHANIATWPELVNWFGTTDVRKTMEISGNIAKESVLEKLQNAR